jgi:hypothetical protein
MTPGRLEMTAGAESSGNVPAAQLDFAVEHFSPLN